MTPTFNTVLEAANAFRRCRTTKIFRLEETSPDAQHINCSACGKLLADFGDAPKGYRAITVHYYPKAKRIRPMHYMCSWGALLGGIAQSYTLAEAGVRVEALSGPTQALKPSEAAPRKRRPAASRGR